MKLHLKTRALAAIAALVIVFGSTAAAARYQSPLITHVSASDAEISSLEDKINSLEKEQKKLLGEISSLKTQKNQALAQKNRYDELMSITTTKISVAEELLTALGTQIADTEANITALSTKMDETLKSFQERMRLSYEEGDASYLGILLGSDNLSDFLSRSERILSFLEYDKKLMQQYEQDKAELEAKKTELEASRKSQEQTKAELEGDKTEYEKLSGESNALIETLSSQTEEAEAAYYEAKKAEDALDLQLKALLEERNKKNSTAYIGGEFIWPLHVRGTITSTFGYRVLWGRNDFHAALDIYVLSGTGVYSANGGEVVVSSYNSSYGNYILIDHGGGKATLYAHCSSLLVSAGQTVSQNQLIAYSGATGQVTGPHLHFEVRLNGQRVNPLSYVRQP